MDGEAITERPQTGQTIIGDRQEAMRGLGAPVRRLDFATPISLLATEEGRMRVTDTLGQMEDGIW